MPAGGVLLGFGQSLALPMGSEAVPGIRRICSLPTPCCIFCSEAGEQKKKKKHPLKRGKSPGDRQRGAGTAHLQHGVRWRGTEANNNKM